MVKVIYIGLKREKEKVCLNSHCFPSTMFSGVEPRPLLQGVTPTERLHRLMYDHSGTTQQNNILRTMEGPVIGRIRGPGG